MKSALVKTCLGCSLMACTVVSGTETVYLGQPTSVPVTTANQFPAPVPSNDPISVPAPSSNYVPTSVYQNTVPATSTPVYTQHSGHMQNPPVVVGDVYMAPIITAHVECVPTRVRGERKIAHNAVPMIVSVPNPCYDKCDPVSVPCVNVEVCVPPCKTACLKMRRHGDKYIYDYGREEVSITVRRNDILVAYN